MRRILFNTLRNFRNSFRGKSNFNTVATNPSSRRLLISGIAGILLGSSVLWWKNQFTPITKALEKPATKKDSVNFDAVRKDIESILERPGYDDGSLGPVFVRLAWHASGTFDKVTGTGGSNGATMRFDPESGHGANAGLQIARDALEPIKKKYPELSYADLWTLAGVVAIEEMGGPKIKWTPGRTDAPHGKCCPPDGRLPDATKNQDHIREIFYRMGFNDREIVALIGAHCLGRCHTDRSGFNGPWTRAPTTVSNMFFQELLQNKWRKKSWNGPMQYEDEKTGELMMLPADLALLDDKEFRKYVEMYAKDGDLWFNDFALAFSKLLDLGVKRQ